jgi:hypothetical protein
MAIKDSLDKAAERRGGIPGPAARVRAVTEVTDKTSG